MKREHEDEAIKHFRKVDPVMHKAAKKYAGSIVSRLAEKRGGDRLFSSLAASVVSQQLSTKAAETIWGRLENACGGAVTPETVSKVSLPHMRAAGLSGAKSKTLKELAQAVKNGLDLPALRRMPEADAVAALTQVWGIGTWTAEMFLIFAIEELYGVPKDSHRSVYEAIAASWAPYRSIASLVLWRSRDEG
jgi:DNA-3-methyladenine glycosylase II